MKKWCIIPMLFSLSCISSDTDDANDLGSLEYSYEIGYPNSEPVLPPNAENVYVHFLETQYVLNLKFAGSDSDTVFLSTCELLLFDDSIDVGSWIMYHHYDAINEYSGINPGSSFSADQFHISIHVLSLETTTTWNTSSIIKASFNVSFQNLTFESTDKHISSFNIDSLFVYYDAVYK